MADRQELVDQEEVIEVEESQVEEAEEPSGASSFGDWDLDQFVKDEAVDPEPIPEVEEEWQQQEDSEDQDDEGSGPSAKAKSGDQKNAKSKLDKAKVAVNMFDTVFSFGMCFVSGEGPKSVDSYKASDSYKKEMAEALAECDWEINIGPEWTLALVAIFCYGPVAVEAFKKRKDLNQKKKAEKKKKSKAETQPKQEPEASDDGVVDADYVELQITEDTTLITNTKIDKNIPHECPNCGKMTEGKIYCSRTCSSAAARKQRWPRN